MDALAVMQRLGNGELMGDIAEALAVTADEVIATGNKGTVTVTLEVLVQQIGDPLVIVRDSVKRTPSKRQPRGIVLYAVHGGLHTRDPRQVEMDFRVVDSAPAETRDTDAATAPAREA